MDGGLETEREWGRLYYLAGELKICKNGKKNKRKERVLRREE